MFLKLTNNHWQKYMQSQIISHSSPYGTGKKAELVEQTWKGDYFAGEGNKQ